MISNGVTDFSKLGFDIHLSTKRSCFGILQNVFRLLHAKFLTSDLHSPLKFSPTMGRRKRSNS